MNNPKPYFPDESSLMQKLKSFVMAAFNASEVQPLTKHFRPIVDISRDSCYRFTVKLPHWGSPKREVDVRSVVGDVRRVCVIYMLNVEGSKEDIIKEERIVDCSRENIYQLGQRISLFLTKGQFERDSNN